MSVPHEVGVCAQAHIHRIVKLVKWRPTLRFQSIATETSNQSSLAQSLVPSSFRWGRNINL